MIDEKIKRMEKEMSEELGAGDQDVRDLIAAYRELEKSVYGYRMVESGQYDQIQKLESSNKRMREALEFIAKQEDLTFAECSLAEEIVSRAKAALAQKDEEGR